MESTRSVVCYQADEHARLRVMPYATPSQLHTMRGGALITYQASFVGLDKKLSNPIGLLNFLEVTIGFEPMDNGVADRGLTTWLRHQNNGADYGARTRHLDLGKVALYQMS